MCYYYSCVLCRGEWKILTCVTTIVSHRNGDLGEVSKYGSVHEYLLHLHQNGRQPIAVFWWGQQRVVSICSPELFKDTIKLTNRPSEFSQCMHVHFVR